RRKAARFWPSLAVGHWAVERSPRVCDVVILRRSFPWQPPVVPACRGAVRSTLGSVAAGMVYGYENVARTLLNHERHPACPRADALEHRPTVHPAVGDNQPR